jgi:hypothetical protein
VNAAQLRELNIRLRQSREEAKAAEQD